MHRNCQSGAYNSFSLLPVLGMHAQSSGGIMKTHEGSRPVPQNNHEMKLGNCWMLALHEFQLTVQQAIKVKHWKLLCPQLLWGMKPCIWDLHTRFPYLKNMSRTALLFRLKFLVSGTAQGGCLVLMPALQTDVVHG